MTSHDTTARHTMADADFRRRVADWLGEHLTGRFEPLRFRGGAGDGDAFPELRKDWERELAAGGWTCIGWPEEHGGRGLPVPLQLAFHEEYARAGAPGRIGHIGEGLIGPTLMAFGTDRQKQRFLPPIVAGREFWAQGYSEPGAGSDLAGLKTRARRDPATGEWRVTGQKVWTSLAHLSDWIFVVARSEDGSAGRDGLSFLLMPLDQPGIDIRPIRQINGGEEFNEVFFDGAVAAPDDILGKPGDGWSVAMALLGFERGISTLGQQMTFAQELDLVVEFARENGSLRRPAVRRRIAHAWAGLRAMRYNALRMLSGYGKPGLAREALGYKHIWSHWHRDLGKLAADVLGVDADVATGDPRRARLQNLFLFSRAETIYGGTSEIQLNIIAERGLGMPKEPRGKA